eukprot:s678_g2.t1
MILHDVLLDLLASMLSTSSWRDISRCALTLWRTGSCYAESNYTRAAGGRCFPFETAKAGGPIRGNRLRGTSDCASAQRLLSLEPPRELTRNSWWFHTLFIWTAGDGECNECAMNE